MAGLGLTSCLRPEIGRAIPTLVPHKASYASGDRCPTLPLLFFRVGHILSSSRCLTLARSPRAPLERVPAGGGCAFERATNISSLGALSRETEGLLSAAALSPSSSH